MMIATNKLFNTLDFVVISVFIIWWCLFVCLFFFFGFCLNQFAFSIQYACFSIFFMTYYCIFEYFD